MKIEVLKALPKAESRSALEDSLRDRLDELQADKTFLHNGLAVAIKDYQKKFNKATTSEEALKNANWEVVEYQTLLQQAQSILATLETVLATLNPTTCTNRIFQRARVTLKDLKIEFYLKNIFKKKRTSASHVLVFMLSYKKRARKPYALPVRYIPYRTLKDQYIRDFTRDIKLKEKLKLVCRYMLHAVVLLIFLCFLFCGGMLDYPEILTYPFLKMKIKKILQFLCFQMKYLKSKLVVNSRIVTIGA